MYASLVVLILLRPSNSEMFLRSGLAQSSTSSSLLHVMGKLWNDTGRRSPEDESPGQFGSPSRVALTNPVAHHMPPPRKKIRAGVLLHNAPLPSRVPTSPMTSRNAVERALGCPNALPETHRIPQSPPLPSAPPSLRALSSWVFSLWGRSGR